MEKEEIGKLKEDLKELQKIEKEIYIAKTRKQKDDLEVSSTSIALEIINKYNLKQIDPSIKYDSICEHVVYDIQVCITKLENKAK